MSKLKTRVLGLIAAAAMLLALLAPSLFFLPRFASAEESAGEATAVMVDPTYQMISLGADDSMMLMSDGTLKGSLTPSAGFGGRANSSALGSASAYTVADGVSLVFKNMSIKNDATLTIAMQTLPTGTIGTGNGGGVHVMFRASGSTFSMTVYGNRASDAPGYFWSPIQNTPFDGDTWTADTISITFTANTLTVSYSGATTGDFASVTINDTMESGAFAGIFEDFNDQEQTYYSQTAYLSFSCYTFSTVGRAEFTLASINDQTPLDGYKAALNAQVTAFVEAVAAAGDGSDQSKVDAAVALNTFGEDQAYGKLLAQYGTEEQKADVAAARATITELNGDTIYAELKGKIDAFVSAVEGYDQFDEATQTAAVEAYNAIDWTLYDELNANYRAQIDETVAAMKGMTFFKNAINDVYDAKLALLETATAAEFSSSDGYLSVKASIEGWETYKADNFFADLAQAQQSAIEERMTAINGKLEDSYYHNFIYRGTESKVQLYEDEGLYLSVKPDVYPATDNAISFKEKMTLGENSEIRFNLIYGLRKLGAFQMQIGFYPVAGGMTKGDVDGVRVDFWLSEAGITEVKPVNGKTELNICGDQVLSLTDEDFFDFMADTLDYTKSDYTVRLAANDDGTLSIFVNDLEMLVTDSALNADLFRDGVYITITGVGYAGTMNNELLVTKIGSTEYVELPDDGDQDGQKDPDENPGGDSETPVGGCSGAVAAGTAVAGAVVLLGTAVVLLRRKRS